MNKDFSLYDFCIYTLLPFGQLFARINLLNSSIDKSWLLLFCFIPFLAIPILSSYSINIDLTIFIIILIISNIFPLLYIQQGLINIPPKSLPSHVDKYVLLPIIIKILIPILYVCLGNNISFFDDNLIFILLFSSIFTSLILRQKKKCNTLNIQKIITSFIDAIFIYTMTNVSSDIYNTLKENTPSIPNSEDFNKILAYLVSAFSILIGYIFINFFNDNDINNYCSDKFYFNNIHVFTVMISLFYYYFKFYCKKKN